MTLAVVGAGVGRTGTNSLKLALEQLLGGRCHHMFEMISDPAQIPGWTAALQEKPTDWQALLSGYVAQVDWPGASFWPELSEANPDALVILSVRSPESWLESASNTIFQVLNNAPTPLTPWFEEVRMMLGRRFCSDLEDPQAMLDAYVRHNDAVRAGVPSSRLLEWTAAEGWEPICERLGLPVPNDPFPMTNDTKSWRAMLGMPALA
jgi:Sulfotransferase domain